MSIPIDTTVNQGLMPSEGQYHTDAAIKIDWFNFETRMRNLIKEMLDPCIDSQYKADTKFRKFTNRIERIEEQIQELEYQATKFDVITK